jgi:hypothetical protein
MRKILKALPIIGPRLAQRDMEREATEAFERYWAWWESLSAEQQRRVAGF